MLFWFIHFCFKFNFNRFCESHNEWYKAKSWSDCRPPSSERYQDLKNYITQNLKLSPQLANLIIENSKEENLPEGLRTAELRIENEDIIKQLTGKYLIISICLHLAYIFLLWISIGSNYFFNNFLIK